MTCRTGNASHSVLRSIWIPKIPEILLSLSPPKEEEMVKFSLYKRRFVSSVYYYVSNWNQERQAYEPCIRIEKRMAQLGDEGSARRIGTATLPPPLHSGLG